LGLTGFIFTKSRVKEGDEADAAFPRRKKTKRLRERGFPRFQALAALIVSRKATKRTEKRRKT
jgi:hypothetical protein